MARKIRRCLAVLNVGLLIGWTVLGSVALMAQSPTPSSATETRLARTGTLYGRVMDRRGQAQAGIPVTILRQDGRYVEKVYTQPNGRFRLGNLPAGLYAAEVAQPSFLPFWKGSIAIEAGAEFLLDIDLLSLADSMEIGVPESLKKASDDWKWALRASYPARPILRFEPEVRSAARSTMHDARERALRGTLQIAAGNESHGFGQDPALRTAFDMAYALQGSQQVGLAGSAGWEHGTPAASMRAAWNRRSGDAASSTLSMTVRQLFLPGEYWINAGDAATNPDRRIQSFTFGYEEEKILGDHLRVQMGSLLDTLNFAGRMTRWSPFARLAYTPTENSRLTFTYTAANPRTLPTESGSERDEVGLRVDRRMDQGLAIPQISGDGSGHPVLEGGRHIETQWDQQLTPQIRLQTAVFYDMLSHTALSLSFAAPDEFTTGLLRDPFSNRYFLSGGGAKSPGARVAVATRLSPSTELIVGYSYAGTLRIEEGDFTVADVLSLRAMLRNHRENSFAVKISSQVPKSHTRVVASYRLLARNSVTASNPYDRGLGQSDPYLHVYVLQPIPSPDILPGQFEAVADFNNLLAQGYLPVRTAGGSVGTLFPAPRTFRGGFNFIF